MATRGEAEAFVEERSRKEREADERKKEERARRGEQVEPSKDWMVRVDNFYLYTDRVEIEAGYSTGIKVYPIEQCYSRLDMFEHHPSPNSCLKSFPVASLVLLCEEDLYSLETADIAEAQQFHLYLSAKNPLNLSNKNIKKNADKR